ncbi:hypothetical protein LPJ53_004088, partial [Coemansia erecta]
MAKPRRLKLGQSNVCKKRAEFAEWENVELKKHILTAEQESKEIKKRALAADRQSWADQARHEEFIDRSETEFTTLLSKMGGVQQHNNYLTNHVRNLKAHETSLQQSIYIMTKRNRELKTEVSRLLSKFQRLVQAA